MVLNHLQEGHNFTVCFSSFIAICLRSNRNLTGRINMCEIQKPKGHIKLLTLIVRTKNDIHVTNHSIQMNKHDKSYFRIEP